jgi:SAM-dependent methyltransferase
MRHYNAPPMAILYQSSWFYHALMAVAYGAHRWERFQAVAHWIPAGAEVLDVCCGDGSLAKHLPHSVRYRGLDQSEAFVREGQRLGRRVEQFDLRHNPLPSSEIVVCQVSLYQFHPNTSETLEKLFEAATQRLIISETVKSLTQSQWNGIASIVAWGTRAPGMATDRFRFTPEGLKALFDPYKAHIRDVSEVCSGRDWVYVIDKQPVAPP